MFSSERPCAIVCRWLLLGTSSAAGLPVKVDPVSELEFRLLFGFERALTGAKNPIGKMASGSQGADTHIQ
jgi:hypothetical protein